MSFCETGWLARENKQRRLRLIVSYLRAGIVHVVSLSTKQNTQVAYQRTHRPLRSRRHTFAHLTGLGATPARLSAFNEEQPLRSKFARLLAASSERRLPPSDRTSTLVLRWRERTSSATPLSPIEFLLVGRFKGLGYGFHRR